MSDRRGTGEFGMEFDLCIQDDVEFSKPFYTRELRQQVQRFGLTTGSLFCGAPPGRLVLGGLENLGMDSTCILDDVDSPFRSPDHVRHSSHSSSSVPPSPYKRSAFFVARATSIQSAPQTFADTSACFVCSKRLENSGVSAMLGKRENAQFSKTPWPG